MMLQFITILLEPIDVWNDYYWKDLWKDVDAHVKQCLMYRQQNLCQNIMQKYT